MNLRLLIYFELFLFGLTHICKCQDQSEAIESEIKSTNDQADSLDGIVFIFLNL